MDSDEALAALRAAGYDAEVASEGYVDEDGAHRDAVYVVTSGDPTPPEDPLAFPTYMRTFVSESNVGDFLGERTE